MLESVGGVGRSPVEFGGHNVIENVGEEVVIEDVGEKVGSFLIIQNQLYVYFFKLLE